MALNTLWVDLIAKRGKTLPLSDKPMSDLFHNLLVSAPNRGALFVLRHGVAYRLDSVGTTGVHIAGGAIYRGIQPGELKVYGKQFAEFQKPGQSIDDIHDVVICDGSLFVVGTERNEILKLSLAGDILDHWTLPGEPDSCHLNCIAKWGSRIIYSCFGDFQTHRGYKANAFERGLVRDLLSGEDLIVSLTQPHSPTPYGSSLLLANSGLQEIREYDENGMLVRKKELGAYTRGMTVRDGILYVGLSSPRPGNEPVSSDFSAKLLALDAVSWEEIGRLALSAGEIYSVEPFSEAQVFDGLLQIAADNEKLREDAQQRIEGLEGEKASLEARVHELEQSPKLTNTDLDLASST